MIISTWNGQEKYLEGIDGIDKIVLSDDPGEGPIQQWKRQTTSYINGFKASTGDLVMVTRSDMIHNKDPFEYLDQYPSKTINGLKMFDNKLVISNMMSINPDVPENPNTFRVCDWMQVGHRKDVQSWCDVMHHVDNLDIDLSDILFQSGQTCTEKLWFLSALKNYHPHINLYDTKSIDHLAWETILSNFIILNTRTTLNSVNLNWKFQPEDLHCYITQDIYHQKYTERFEL